MQKTFSSNNIIWHAFSSKFATFNDFEKKNQFFWEKSIYFFNKKSNFVRIWEILLFQSHSMANFLKFGVEKNFQIQHASDILPEQLASKRKKNVE